MIHYICSPYGDKTLEQKQICRDYAKYLTRRMLLRGYYPITPHLYITPCLDPDECEIGLEAAFELLKHCDAVLVGQRYGINERMAAEIKKAKQLKMPVFYYYDAE